MSLSQRIVDFFGQPAKLYILFFAEMWERYGFYTNRTILTLYMTEKLLLSNDHAYAIFGAFTALLYLTPTAGGFAADRLLGYRRAILIGGLFLAAGYALLAVPGLTCFYYGLAAVIIGNGFFKPNVSAAVGQLYERNDPRRAGGFSIFYAGINIGAMLPTLIVAYLISVAGWPAAFLMATAGVLLGLAVLFFGLRNDKKIGMPPELDYTRPQLFTKYMYLILGVVVTFVAMVLLCEHTTTANYVLFIFGGAFVAYSLFKSFTFPPKQRNRLLLCHILILFSILFWVLYQQAAMSLTIFTQFNTNRHFINWNIPTMMFQSFNPLTIIVFAPILSWLWVKLSKFKKNMNPSIPGKFAYGTIFMGAGFIFLPFLIKDTGHTGLISFWWIIFSYFLQSIGELLVSPVGLSMVTELSPLRMVGLMMGAWFFASAVANSIAAYAAQWTTIASGSNNPLLTNGQYALVFGWLGGTAIVAGIIALAFTPLMKRLLSERLP